MGPVEHRFALEGGFPADSPFLDGHFSGNPIVPGAIILGFLATRLAERDLAIARVGRMKFRRILRPGISFEASVTERASSASAEFRDAEGVFASASLHLRARDA